MYYRSGKAIYFKNGSVDDGAVEPSEHIADAQSEEKAHAIVYHLNNQSGYFIRDALVTLSPEYHGDMVSNAEFRGRLNGAIDALNKLDQVKKTLFYGRDNNLIAEGQRDATAIPESVHSNRGIATDIIHAIIGFATEAGELLEALKAAINGNGFDWVNIQEELGDAAWYAAILAERGDFTFEEYQQRIIAKLRARYPDKFAAFNANNRNLELERSILESDASHVSLESIVDGPTSETVTELGATPPVGGAAAVEALTPAIDAGFDALKPTSLPAEAEGVGGTGDSELAKSPGARMRKLPGEDLARQPIRPEDAKK